MQSNQSQKEPCTIKREMFLLSVVFLILASLLFSAIFLQALYSDSMRSAKTSLLECNDQIVTYTEGIFHETAMIVEILACNETVIRAGDGDPKAILAELRPILENNENITYIYAGYENGSLIIDNYPTPPDFNATTRPWYLAAASTRNVAQLAYADAATGVWLFSQCKRLVDQNGVMTGVVAIDCSNESISEQLSAKYRYTSQRSFLTDPEGIVLIHPSEAQINTSLKEMVDAAAWDDVASEGGGYLEYTKDGRRAMACLERIPGTDFFAATAINSSEVTTPIVRSMVGLFFLTAFISVALGALLSRILIRRFARPIIELGGRISRIASGNPGVAADIGASNAEIGDIAQGIETIVKDIATREELRKRAEYLSFHDSMTGLYNRRFFDEELRRLDVRRNYPLCLVCCDINGLKLVNDVFGHAAGDRLIAAIAGALNKGCRADDILARIGGDEFAIILPHTSPQDAQLMIRRLKAGLPGQSVSGAKVSVSLGYAVKAGPEQQIDEVLRSADEMMYQEKLMESLYMKRNTIAGLYETARDEGLLPDLTPEELFLLDELGKELCPDLIPSLKESYGLRKIGQCSLVSSQTCEETDSQHYTERGYRILSQLDDTRIAAYFVLHYREHWDGSGHPAGLAGEDIPLPSRIMAAIEAHTDGKGTLERHADWFDPRILTRLEALCPLSPPP